MADVHRPTTQNFHRVHKEQTDDALSQLSEVLYRCRYKSHHRERTARDPSPYRNQFQANVIQRIDRTPSWPPSRAHIPNSDDVQLRRRIRAYQEYARDRILRHTDPGSIVRVRAVSLQLKNSS